MNHRPTRIPNLEYLVSSTFYSSIGDTKYPDLGRSSIISSFSPDEIIVCSGIPVANAMQVTFIFPKIPLMCFNSCTEISCCIFQLLDRRLHHRGSRIACTSQGSSKIMIVRFVVEHIDIAWSDMASLTKR
eukprot:scaffold12982_cov129-Cylindrotheca_fusiformis.AAC.10